MDVLSKILSLKEKKDSAEIVQKFLEPKPIAKKLSKKRPGRPALPLEKKARNFTLCLAPKYLEFLDTMQVKEKKIQGRGRKVRYIIDQFLVLHKRQRAQLEVMREFIRNVKQQLETHSHQVKKGEKLLLSAKEKAEINKVVKELHLVVQLLGYSPKELQKLLSNQDWSVISFSLNWIKNERT